MVPADVSLSLSFFFSFFFFFFFIFLFSLSIFRRLSKGVFPLFDKFCGVNNAWKFDPRPSSVFAVTDEGKDFKFLYDVLRKTGLFLS